MKIQFLATGQAPDKYEFEGETITAYQDEQGEPVDLSPIEAGGEFEGVGFDTLDLHGQQVIRNAERKDSTLHVTLCQQAGSGHWQESNWMDADDYDSEQIYIKEVDNGDA